MLDEALMQTFPASDPVALKSCCACNDGAASAGSDPVPHGTGPNDGHAPPREPVDPGQPGGAG
jgi:hypothetical protein